MTSEETKQLISKYNKGECSEQEIALIEQWFMQLNGIEIDLSPDTITEIGNVIFKKLPHSPEKGKGLNLWSTILSTAAVLGVIFASTLLYKSKQSYLLQKPLIVDVRPGGNRAILMLSNGQTIRLRSDKKVIVINQKKLSYADGTKIPVADLSAVQTINTPKGGHYQIELPDGTNVWLNSSTTVQYTANLNIESGVRKFRLVAGEAYFKVKKDKSHPFVVTSKGQEVTVLGTEFNINAYSSNTATKTTLVEGSVKVSIRDHHLEKILCPGQQARSSSADVTVSVVDLELETAWKRGKIEFEDADLRTVMTMLERWYDTKTVYQTNNSESRFTGSIARSKNISAVLKLLESTGEVHFKIEGRKVIVTK